MVTWPKQPKSWTAEFISFSQALFTKWLCAATLPKKGGRWGRLGADDRRGIDRTSQCLLRGKIKLCEHRQWWHIWQVFTSLQLLCVTHIMEKNTNWATVALWPWLLVNVTAFGDANGHIVCPPPSSEASYLIAQRQFAGGWLFLRPYWIATESLG